MVAAGIVAPQGTLSAKAGPPLRTAVDEFLDSIRKPKTYRTYRTWLNKQAIPFFKPETPITAIEQQRFVDYVDHIFAIPKGAHAAKEGYVVAFTAMFHWYRAKHPALS